MNKNIVIKDSLRASELIKKKLVAAGGVASVPSLSDNTYEIRIKPDGKAFACKALPQVDYEFTVFDVIVDLLISQNGKAKKGNGHKAKIGEAGCEETTIVGAIGKNYFGKSNGESTYDPVFVLAAILEWADIAYNERGYMMLTANYMSKISE